MFVDKTVIISLIGLAGSGKYTIAKEISENGYKLIDNHLINNPILSLLDLDGISPIPKIAWDAIYHIRNAVLEFIQEDSHTNYVFTNELLKTDIDRDIYNKVLNAAIKRNSIFVPVKLQISSKELARRIVSPERQQLFKTTNIDEAYNPKELINITHENLLELDITNLEANTVSSQILLHVAGLIKNDN